MVQALLWAACLLLCLDLTESISCDTCLVKSRSTGCLTGLEGCITLGAKCMTIRIFYKGKVKIRIHGCSKRDRRGCGVEKESGDHKMTIRCCNSDRCNAGKQWGKAQGSEEEEEEVP